MSTYYEYREVKVMIAHRLMSMEGWKVYGYSPDQSDSMTDYYCPAHWDGIAEKNGYILVVNNSRKAEQEEIKKYNKNYVAMDSKTRETIKKLEALTMDRGASEQEEQTAKEKIELLRSKANENNANISQYEVVGVIPGHEANPPKCNWHIEKDGVIIAKGNGLLKFSSIYYDESDNRNGKNPYKVDVEKLTKEYMQHGYYSDHEKALKAAMSHKKDMDEKKKLADKFNELIHKFDTTCGGILGSGDLVTYEKIIVTEYKTENKAIETTEGSIKEGQCFILKTNFNYGSFKGLVYRIHESEHNGKKYYNAYKLNGKLTKECTGRASSNNSWGTFGEKFLQWIEKGSISWCEIQEVKTPYEVEKVVKKVIKTDKKEDVTKKAKQSENKTGAKEETKQVKNNYTYEIKEDVDTRNNEKIFVVKVIEKLDREKYIQVNNNMKSLGGYYSKFKHGFIFKVDPTEVLTDSTEVNEKPKQSYTDAEIAEIIEDYSTEIITNLGLKYPDYVTNEEYIKQLESKTEHLLSGSVLDCIAYEGLKQALTTILNNINKEDIKQKETEHKEEPQKKSIDYEIEESKHTQTKEPIWLVKIKTTVSKGEFSEIKRNFATLKGFYSSFNNSFIFRYDPTEKLKNTA